MLGSGSGSGSAGGDVNPIPQIVTVLSHYQDSMDYLEESAK